MALSQSKTDANDIALWERNWKQWVKMARNVTTVGLEVIEILASVEGVESVEVLLSDINKSRSYKAGYPAVGTGSFYARRTAGTLLTDLYLSVLDFKEAVEEHPGQNVTFPDHAATLQEELETQLRVIEKWESMSPDEQEEMQRRVRSKLAYQSPGSFN